VQQKRVRRKSTEDKCAAQYIGRTYMANIDHLPCRLCKWD